jgi:hypothetical protein
MTKEAFIAEALKRGYRKSNWSADSGCLLKEMQDGTVYRYKLGARKVWHGVFYYRKGWYTWESAFYGKLKIDRMGLLKGWKQIKNPKHMK